MKIKLGNPKERFPKDSCIKDITSKKCNLGREETMNVNISLYANRPGRTIDRITTLNELSPEMNAVEKQIVGEYLARVTSPPSSKEALHFTMPRINFLESMMDSIILKADFPTISSRMIAQDITKMLNAISKNSDVFFRYQRIDETDHYQVHLDYLEEELIIHPKIRINSSANDIFVRNEVKYLIGDEYEEKKAEGEKIKVNTFLEKYAENLKGLKK